MPEFLKHRLQALFSFESKRATVLNHFRIGLRLRSLGQENITELEQKRDIHNTPMSKGTWRKGWVETGVGSDPDTDPK